MQGILQRLSTILLRQITRMPHNFILFTRMPHYFYLFTRMPHHYLKPFRTSTLIPCWHFPCTKVKSLESFHQLARSQGAFAGTSLCIDYSSPFVAPYKALIASHWAPLLTSLLSISTLFITHLSPTSELFSTTSELIPA